MLKKIIVTERGLDRHRNTLLAPYLDEYLSDLEKQGYRRKINVSAFMVPHCLWRVSCRTKY